MVDSSRKMDLEKLVCYGDNLTEFLKDEKDKVGLKHFLLQSSALRSQCDKDSDQVQKSIEEYVKKLDQCKKKADAVESECVTDAESSSLQAELEQEQQLERKLREELRAIVNEISELDRQGDSIEEQNQTIKKLEQDDIKAQMKLSMYASVTKIIPYLDDQCKISGHIVEKDKKVVEKFEFDLSKVTAFEACNDTWKMIKS